MIAEKCERFSGGQSCSKLMESITFMVWDALIPIINVIGAAGL